MTSRVVGLDDEGAIMCPGTAWDDDLGSLVRIVDLHTCFLTVLTLFVDEPSLLWCRFASHLSIELDHLTSTDGDVLQRGTVDVRSHYGWEKNLVKSVTMIQLPQP